jgi:hypothetical protein
MRTLFEDLSLSIYIQYTGDTAYNKFRSWYKNRERERKREREN